MDFDVAVLGAGFPALIVESRRTDSTGTHFELRLPAFRPGREFASAKLWLPKGFPETQKARIRLSVDAILRIPHVESGGLLCTSGEPGPGAGFSTLERLQILLSQYHYEFLVPWLEDELDGDFLKEAQNYWTMEVARCRRQGDPVVSVLTVDAAPGRARVIEGVLFLPSRVVVAADKDSPIVRRLMHSLGKRVEQHVRVRIADIPISDGFVPSTWPRDAEVLQRLISVRLQGPDRDEFLRPIRRRQPRVHRVVVFRSPQGNFGYLLPNGPPTVVRDGKHVRARPARLQPVPLLVDRIDPDWTVGRDQHAEVAARQKSRVLVFGAGALGSPVIDHLAKAGVGHITIVDEDEFAPANIGRHLLGVDALHYRKSEAVADRVGRGHPSCSVIPVRTTAESWFQRNSLDEFDVVVDLTGEPDVRWVVDQARRASPCRLLIGWMEPYVAAAHVCTFPAGEYWYSNANNTYDRRLDLEAIEWPKEVIRQEPGCSSRFQAYTAAQAAYAVALVAEQAINLIDGKVFESAVHSWVRGQQFLDKNWPGLSLRDWAENAKPHDGLIIKRNFI